MVTKEIIIDCKALAYIVQEEANLQGDDLGGSGVFLVGVCCPVLQILTYHRPKRGGQGMG